MKTSIILSTLAAGIAIAAPAPAPVLSSTIEKRADTNVLVCTDRNFQGSCINILSESSKCNAHFSDEFTNSISSVKPSEGSFCYFFVAPDCSTNADFFHVGYPGVADLSVTPVNGPEGSTRNFENKLTSFFCIVDQ